MLFRSTTADPSAPLSGTPDDMLDALLALAEVRHGTCALAVAIERADADRLLEDGVTVERLRDAALAAHW